MRLERKSLKNRKKCLTKYDKLMWVGVSKTQFTFLLNSVWFFISNVRLKIEQMKAGYLPCFSFACAQDSHGMHWEKWAAFSWHPAHYKKICLCKNFWTPHLGRFWLSPSLTLTCNSHFNTEFYDWNIDIFTSLTDPSFSSSSNSKYLFPFLSSISLQILKRVWNEHLTNHQVFTLDYFDVPAIDQAYKVPLSPIHGAKTK